MAQKTRPTPINMSLTIEPGSLKKVVEEGRLEEFVDTLSTLAAAHIRKEIVNQVAREVAGGASLKVGFLDDREYGTGPWPWPWPHNSGIFEETMRQLQVNKLETLMRQRIK